jgi:hypothetical protein
MRADAAKHLGIKLIIYCLRYITWLVTNKTLKKTESL